VKRLNVEFKIEAKFWAEEALAPLANKSVTITLAGCAFFRDSNVQRLPRNGDNLVK